MNNQITGTLHKVLELESGVSKQGKDWKRQSFIIKTKSTYPKEVCITASGSKCDIVPTKPGQEITVYFNPESKEWNGKYFTTLVLDKVEY